MSQEEEVTEQGLTEDKTIHELFEFFKPEPGHVQLVPMTIKEDPEDTRLLLLIRGGLETSSVIFAELMSTIRELSDLEKQAEAAKENGPRIITR